MTSTVRGSSDTAIVFCTNDSYSILLGVMLCSLFENNRTNRDFDIFVIDSGISEASKAKLKVLEDRYGFALQYVVLDQSLFSGVSFGQFPPETFQRVGIARILPESYKRVLYVDCDMIVRGDIAPLLTADLKGKTIGAVADCFQHLRLNHLRQLCQRVGAPFPAKPLYFNAGMLLIDLDRWRARDVGDKLVAVLRDHGKSIAAADQDALNLVFLDDCVELPQKYNFLVGSTDAREANPVFVHFAGGSKPWYVFSALPYQREYVMYANKTPWKYKKYRKLVDIFFAKKYGIYGALWAVWSFYKRVKRFILRTPPPQVFLPNE